MQWPIIAIKNLTSLFPLIFLSKNISLYALGRLKWILDIIWPLNQHFNLKNERNWMKQVWMLKFWSGINCILLHWPKKLTLPGNFFLLLTSQPITIHSSFNIAKLITGIDWNLMRRNSDCLDLRLSFSDKFIIHSLID